MARQHFLSDDNYQNYAVGVGGRRGESVVVILVVMAASSEVTSLEQLLDTAGERPLDTNELSEVKRILYGNPAKYGGSVSSCNMLLAS